MSLFSSNPVARRRRHGMFLILFLFVGLIVALGIVAILAVGRVLSGAKDVQASLVSAQNHATQLDFDSANRDLDDLSAGLEKTKSGLELLVWTHPLPWVGDQVQAAEVVVDSGIESAAALQQAMEVAGEAMVIVQEARDLVAIQKTGVSAPSFKDFPQEQKKALLRTLHNAFPKLKEMETRLTLAQEDLDKLDDLDVMPAFLEAVAPMRKVIPELLQGVHVLVPISAAADQLSGIDGDKQWLLLFENNAELRPGGGFLGVIGLALAHEGDLTNLVVQDVYSYDVFANDPAYFVVPPQPLVDYMGVPKWFLRDANWSPDFSTSAKTSMQLLRQEVALSGQPIPEIHGVVGFTPTFVSDLMVLTGPIVVDGFTFTHENVYGLLQEEVEYGFVDRDISFDDRKQIVAHLTDAMVDRLLSLPSEKWSALFDTIIDGFAEKQIAMYSVDEDAQAAFEDAGWSGAVAAGKADDHLMVVDANLAALKTDPVVERSINYSIKPDGNGGYAATTAITYNNTGSFTKFTTRYRTYTRVFAPQGSVLLSSSGTLANDKLNNPSLAEGTVLTENDLGMTSFGSFTSVEPGETRTLSFTYQLPEVIAESIENGVYQLEVFKQMGAADHALTLDLNFGKNVKRATPSEDASEFGDKRYVVDAELDENQLFTVEF